MVDVEYTPIDAPPPPQGPLPTDGWRSRKIIIGAATLGLLIVLSFSCLFIKSPGTEVAIGTFDQVSGFWQILVPSVLVPLMGALGLDKFAEAKREGK